MRSFNTFGIFFIFCSSLQVACSSSDTGAIDKLLGNFSSAPILTSVPDQIVSQDDLLKVDINNIKEGLPGSDADMNYACVYDTLVDGKVEGDTPCADIPNSTVDFEAAGGVLKWTPRNGALGNYEIKITGKNADGTYDEVFTVGVRLKFSGLGLFTQITGTSVTANWTPNPAAQGYQVFKLNSLTGQYETLKSVTGGSSSGTTITGLTPNTPYTLRVQAIDPLGNLDGNVVSRSLTTTELVKLSMSSSAASMAAGSAVNITVQAFNANGTPQTIGGLPVTPAIASGTSSGSFSAVTDNNNGTYSFTFTPTIVGTALTIDVSINISFFLNNTVSLSVLPGPASAANSSISVSSGTVVSGNNVTLTATLRDAYNNTISSGPTLSFTKSGGSSTGSFSAVNNQGSGIYSATYTGILAGSAQTLGVQVDSTPLALSTSIQVLPGTPVSATSTLAVNSSSISSGTAAALTATLRDINSNPVSSGVMLVFNKSGGTSSGNFDPIVNAGNGVYTTSYNGVISGTAQTISISVDGVTLTPTVTVAVVPGPASIGNSNLTVTSPSLVSGSFVTVSATLKDVNNNPIESGVTVSFAKNGGTATGTFGSVTHQGNGVYNIRYTGVTAGSAQTLTVLVNGTSLGLSTSVAVTPGSPSPGNSSIAVSGASVISSQSVTVTATVRDDNNNVISSGVSVAFAKSGGTSTGNFGSVQNQGSGVYTVSYTGVTAGSAQNLGILIDGIALGPTTTIAVLPGAPASLLSTLTLTANTVIAGQNVTLTATIKDDNNNPISAGILVSFDKIGGGSFGDLSTVTNQGNGVYTATYTGVTAGTAQTLQANVNGAGFGPTQSIQVLVGAPLAANSTFTLGSPTVASGSAVAVTAVIRDSQNNPITSEYAITIDAVGGSSTGTLSTLNNAGAGTFTSNYTGLIAGSAQTLRVLADGVPIAGLTKTLQVLAGPASASTSTFSIGSSTVQSGTATTLSMNLRDANSNAITSGATVTFNKTAGVSDGTISTVNNTGNGNYNATYTATTMGSAQNIALVVNTISIGLSVTATVTAGPPTHFAVSTPVGAVPSIDCNGPYTLTLKDVNENTTQSLTPVSIALSATPAGSEIGTLFTDSSCSTVATGLSIPVLTSNLQFYYKAYVPNNFTLTLTPNAGISAANVSINNYAVLSWIGASAFFTMNGSGSNTVVDDSSGGLWQPYDTTISGDYLYAVDYNANRILRYNIVTNQFAGWIGYIGSTEGMAAADLDNPCSAPAINALTTSWCLGGRVNITATTLMNNLRSITADSTYIYVSSVSNHRILRFKKIDGSFQGWIGKTGGTAATSPASCVSAGANATTPTWCYGGNSTTGTADGQFNSPAGLATYSGKLYIADAGNHRIQKIDLSSGVAEGWVGQANTTPPSAGQLATCSSQPAVGAKTPGWCLGGTSRNSRRNKDSISTTPSEAAPPDEGFYSPNGLATDGSYLYVGDSSNYRIARLDLSSGAFAGWIGYIYRSTVAVSPTVPSQSSSTYTNTWTSGGVTEARSSNGFGSIYGISVDAVNGLLYIGDNQHRVIRIRTSDGQDLRWIGRAGASPTGGYTGCSSTPIGGTNPGWCVNGGGARYGNTNGTFYTPAGLSVGANKLYVADASNFRIQRFDIATGVFDGWIGAGNISASKWSRNLASGANAARSGIDDYSFGDMATVFAGITMNNNHLFVADVGWNRIKKYKRQEGSFAGYIGQILNNGGFYPTGPEACVGYTNGMTPDWCSGGGRTTNGSGIHGYNNPYSVASDEDYVYIANYSNHRIDRVRVSDALYLGWIGEVNATPTDGDPACLNAVTPDPAPNWCIGGSATSGNTNGLFNAPRALFYDSLDSVLYAIDNTSRIMKIDPANGAFLAVTGGMASGTGCTVTNAVAASWCTAATGSSATARFGSVSSASGLAVNNNAIFVADSGNHRIAKFDKTSGAPLGIISKLTNNTNVNTSATGGACTGMTTGYPRITPGWCNTNTLGQTMTNVAGTEEGAFNTPRGIWADNTYVYVADTLNNRLVRINAATGAFAGWKGLITSIAGMSNTDCINAGVGAITPVWCSGGSSGAGKQLGAFDYPTGLFGDSNYIYVHDGRNNRVQAVPKN